MNVYDNYVKNLIKDHVAEAHHHNPGPRVRCKKCGDIIQSVYRHDFKWCKCKSTAVDGGGSYLKLCGTEWEVLSDEG